MMTEILGGLVLLLSLASLVLLIFILVRLPQGEKINAFREELRTGREEASRAARESRDEISKNLKDGNETISITLSQIAALQRERLDEMTGRVQALSESNHSALDRFGNLLEGRVKELQSSNGEKIEQMRSLLVETLDDKLGQNRQVLSQGLSSANETLSTKLTDMAQVQRIQLDSMTKELKALAESNQESLQRIRLTLDSRVKELQDSNEKKLDDMRKTVDEKLHETLNQRLGASFQTVSERLEAVQRGLGEMQTLAAGVGDLQRVLTNVKVRGTWAEVQLGALLDQILAAGQYDKNVRVKPDSGESVEYAIRLPGKGDNANGCLWLPVDSKFPQEDYRRLQDAADRADPEATKKAIDDLLRTVRTSAQQVYEKYVNPPITTDFAIMFLATEGLYSEVLRHSSLVEELQRRYRIVIAGPTTLAAILNSLRMGFQTLAIEQRASEVVSVLGAVKTEFGRFGGILDKVKRQLDRTTRTIEQAGVRSRAIEKQLKSVEQLPEPEATVILKMSPTEAILELEEPDECEIMAGSESE